MLTARRPFEGDSFSAIADKQIREDPEPLESISPEVPRSLSAVVHKALAKASRDRYGTAKALREALESYRRQSRKVEFVERVREEEQVEVHRRSVAVTPIPSPAASQLTGPDWVGCLLGMMAFMAVLGLIPLWVTVYLRYFA